MGSKRLRLYRIDAGYARELARHDSHVMSVEPAKHKEKRPFVGIVVPHGSKRYCVPLSSPKPKHVTMRTDKDFSKIVDERGKLIGVLNFNNMFPVNDSVLVTFDIRVQATDSESEKAYKHLMQDQLRWCNERSDLIQRKAAKLYSIVTERSSSASGLVRRCCNFRLLERILDEWTATHATRTEHSHSQWA